MKNLFFMGILLCLCVITHAQNITFPDANFKTALLTKTSVDANRNGEISISEAEQALVVNVQNSGITDLTGIEHFTNLSSLVVKGNRLTTINTSKNTKLKTLDVASNHVLTSMDVSKNIELTSLVANGNGLTTLNVSSNVKLTTLHVSSNSLSAIDVSKNIKLERLFVGYNNLTFIDVIKNTELNSLDLGGNNLTSVDLAGSKKIEWLDIRSNKIESLDVRPLMLTYIDFRDNPNLTKAYLTGQKFRTSPSLALGFPNCPKLEFICIDKEYIPLVYELFDQPHYTSCFVSDDCDLTYCKISGNIRYDLNDNGCDVNDAPFSDLKIILTGGSAGVTQVFPNDNGEYSVNVLEGEYYMFPNLRNPNYFVFNPAILPQPFRCPQDGTTPVRDFCVVPYGTSYNDLEVLIVPDPTGGLPRPGFDTGYLITYKNNGNTVQSGDITLDYSGDILKLESAIPTAIHTTADQLSWSFSNLAPLESRTIKVVLKINRPTDTPDVQLGDILKYKVTVASTNTTNEETPEDNVSLLNQTVVNAYDPNDKTCLEGEIVAPEYVGKYLHYMIRFENEGTANAINVTIKDDIDTTKLDMESFVPLQASHLYTTQIVNKKEVEFIFENINLPYDDANNDGYVLFKIRSKAHLVEGDAIDNKAAIYFDFNPPIITDVETVTFKTVTEEPVFEDYFTLSPNPTQGNLVLTPKNTNITVQSISIHDASGNIVGFFAGTTREFNLSYLFPNTYIMRLQTDKGILSATFVKIN